MKRVAAFFRGESGRMLLIAIIIMAFGELVVLSLSTYVTASLLSVRSEKERIRSYYAAEGGIEAVIADLRGGAVPEGDYPWTAGSVNGYGGGGEPAISITVSSPGAVVVEPQTAPNLPIMGSFEMGTEDPFQDGDAIDPPDAIRLRVTEAMASGPTEFRVAYVRQDGGLAFEPGRATVPADAQVGVVVPIVLSGGDQARYVVAVYAINSRGYSIVSQAGSTIIECIARQSPYPGMNSEYTVEVLTWELR